MKTVTAIRHVHFEDLGTLGPVLADRGLRVDYVEAGGGGLAGVDALAPDLLVVLGGPIGVNDGAAYPFLSAELSLLERRLAAGRPTMGICLGAQLVARALGARVYPGPTPEIGWSPLTLTAAGRSSPARHLAGELTSMFHWHCDTFDLPPAATLLASTPVVANQVFAVGDHALALQCHPEISAAALEHWLIGHTVELARAGLDPQRLRDDTRSLGPALARAATACFREWLDHAGL